MTNAVVNLVQETIGGPGPFIFHLPVKASTHVYRGTLGSQTSGGYLLPYSALGAGVCVGVIQNEQDNSTGADGDRRAQVETRRMYALDNGTSGDAFADTDQIGSVVYATDDHTVAKTSSGQTRKAVGFFYGFEADGKVRVYIDPPTARFVDALQTLADSPATPDALREAIVAAFG